MSNRPSKKPLPSQRVHDAHNQANRSRTIWIIGAVAMVILFAVIVTAVARGGNDEKAADSSTSGGTVVAVGDTDYGTVEVNGTPLPPMAEGGADAAVGQPVPTLTGQQFNGANIAIGNDGKPKVILGIAHWCPHCQKEVPIIQKWLDDNGMPADVEIVAVSTSATESRGNWPASEWLNGEGWTVPTLVDDQDGTAATAIGVSGFPYMLVVDAEGNVVYRTSGEKTVEEWEAIVDAARTGVAPTS